jgi:TolB protein
MNYKDYLRQLFQLSILCLLLTACVQSSIPSLPGKIAYSVATVDQKKGIWREDIYVMRPDGSGRVRLTKGTGYNKDVTWSPDGQQIAFTSQATYNQNAGLYIMNADGDNAQILVTETVGNLDWDPIGHLAWSPNGQEIAHTIGIGAQIHFTDLEGYLPKSLFPLSNNYLEEYGFIFCTSPSWSPDNGYLAIDCSSLKTNKNSNVYKFKSDGSTIECLTCSSALDVEFFYDPHWSPDGKQIGFIGWFYIGNVEYSMIYVMDPEGSNQKPLLDIQVLGRIQDWAWSPDGQWVVVISMEDRSHPDKDPSLLFYKVDGSQSYRVTNFPGQLLDVDWGR